MKKITLLLSAVLLCNIALSQNVNVQKGQEFESEERTKFKRFIGKDENSIYSLLGQLKATSTQYYIEKTNYKTSKQIYSIPIDGEPEEIFIVKDKLLLFSNSFVRKDQTRYFLMDEIDCKTGKKIGDQKIISSLPESSSNYVIEKRNFYITFSPDYSKMAVINESKWPKKESEIEVSIYETDTYKKISTKKLVTSYNNSTTGTSNYKLSNTGTFYYIFYYMINFEEEIGGYAFASITSNASSSVVTPLQFEKVEVKSGSLEIVNDNLIFCGVFKDAFTRGERKSGEETNAGFYKFYIDGKTDKITHKGFDYFSEDVKTKLTYKDSDVEESTAGKKYGLEKIITINEDTYLIESHSYGFRVSTSNQSKDFFTEREYIITKFNNKGQVQWMRVIPKFTVNLNDFNYIVKNNTIYLVYLDHPKNIKNIDINNYNPKKVAKVKNIDEANVVCTSIDDKGNLSRKELFLNVGLFHLPSIENIIINDNELLIRLYGGKKARFDKITVN